MSHLLLCVFSLFSGWLWFSVLWYGCEAAEEQQGGVEFIVWPYAFLNCWKLLDDLLLLVGCWQLRSSVGCCFFFRTHPSGTHDTLHFSFLLYLYACLSLSSYFHSSLCHTSDLFFLPPPKLQTSCFLSFVLLPPPPSSSSTRSPSSSSEPLEEHHVAQLLRCLSTDLSLGRRQLPLDRALAHHLHQCSYHLRLFRNWLVSGQDPIEYLHGQPLAPPSIPQPHALINLCSRSPWDCACSVVDSHALPPNVSACLPVSVMQIASCSSMSCLELLALFSENSLSAAIATDFYPCFCPVHNILQFTQVFIFI